MERFKGQTNPAARAREVQLALSTIGHQRADKPSCTCTSGSARALHDRPSKWGQTQLHVHVRTSSRCSRSAIKGQTSPAAHARQDQLALFTICNQRQTNPAARAREVQFALSTIGHQKADKLSCTCTRGPARAVHDRPSKGRQTQLHVHARTSSRCPHLVIKGKTNPAARAREDQLALSTIGHQRADKPSCTCTRGPARAVHDRPSKGRQTQLHVHERTSSRCPLLVIKVGTNPGAREVQLALSTISHQAKESGVGDSVQKVRCPTCGHQAITMTNLKVVVVLLLLMTTTATMMMVITMVMMTITTVIIIIYNL